MPAIFLGLYVALVLGAFLLLDLTSERIGALFFIACIVILVRETWTMRVERNARRIQQQVVEKAKQRMLRSIGCPDKKL